MPKSHPRARRFARLTPLLLAILPARPLLADTWTAAVSGIFSDNTKWADGSAPLAADSAIFSPAGTYAVTFLSSPTTSSLNVSAGNVTFQSAAVPRTYAITGNATLSGAATTLTLAAPSTSLALNVTGGLTSSIALFAINSGNDLTVGTGGLTIASSNDSTLALNGAGTTLTSTANTTTIALSGNVGALTFANGATGSLAAINLAVSSSNGSSATFSVTNGSSVTAAGNVSLATNGFTNQNALLEVSGAAASSFTQTGATSLTIGSLITSNLNTEGRVNIFTGGTLTTGTGPITVNPTGFLVMSAGVLNANGNLTVNGGSFETNAGSGSLLNLAAGTTLTVQAGGDINLDALNAPAGRNVTVADAGSTGLFGSLTLGSVTGASSTLTIGTAALVTVTSASSVAATGVVNIAGGTLASLGNFTLTGGTFTQTGGTFSLGSGRSFVAQSNATINAVGVFPVSGNNAFINGGSHATFSPGTLTIGTSLGAGTLTVSGPGSTLTITSGGPATPIAAGGFDGSLLLADRAAATLASPLNVGTTGTNSDGLVSISSSATLNTSADINLGGGTSNNTGTLAVAGPLSAVTQTAASTNVGSPSPTSTGSGTLNVLAGASFSAAAVTLNPTGTINVTDAAANLGTFTYFGGTLNFNSGSLTFANDIVIGPTQIFGTSLTLGPTRALATTSILQIDPNSLLTLDGGTLTVAGSFNNNGTFLFNAGRLNLSSLTLGANAPFTTNLSLGPNRTLAITNTFSVPPAAQLTLDGATLSANTLANAGNTAINAGSLSATTLTNTGILSLNAGILLFTGPSANAAGAALVIGPSATATFNSTLTNSGEIYLAGALATLAGPSTLTNTGLIRGDGRIAKPLTNSSTGELRAESGKRLKVDALLGPSAGKITLLGGTAEFSSPLTNTGTITGRGTLIAASLTNQGTLSLSAGLSDVFAPLTNAAAAKTILTGNATATFYNPVINSPGSEFRVSAGSSAVFLAPVTGAGLFTGTGAKFFEAGASAPAFLATSGDTTVEQTASLTTSYLHESSLTTYGPVTLTPDSPASTLTTLDLTTTGTLDLANDDLTITSIPLPTLRTYLLTQQLFSTTATADPLHLLALGYSDSAPTLITLTYYGDANLDGKVNADDYALLDRGFLQHLSTWQQGDFNYDGTINTQDYLLIDRTFLSQAQGFSAGFLSMRESQFGAPYVSQLLASLPEPSSLVACAFAIPTLARRRRF